MSSRFPHPFDRLIDLAERPPGPPMSKHRCRPIPLPVLAALPSLHGWSESLG